MPILKKRELTKVVRVSEIDFSRDGEATVTFEFYPSNAERYERDLEIDVTLALDEAMVNEEGIAAAAAPRLVQKLEELLALARGMADNPQSLPGSPHGQ